MKKILTTFLILFFIFFTTSAYAANSAFNSSADEWTDLGSILHPAEIGDDIALGNTTLVNAAKLSIDGDADQTQFSLQGFSTQTTDLVIWEQSDGTDLFNFDNDGNLTILGDLTFDGRFDIGTVETFTDTDATPDVSTGTYWNTFTNTLVITDFDGASITDGQIIYVISKAAITFDCTASGLKCGGVDLVTAAGDITAWYLRLLLKGPHHLLLLWLGLQ